MRFMMKIIVSLKIISCKTVGATNPIPQAFNIRFFSSQLSLLIFALQSLERAVMIPEINCLINLQFSSSRTKLSEKPFYKRAICTDTKLPTKLRFINRNTNICLMLINIILSICRVHKLFKANVCHERRQVELALFCSGKLFRFWLLENVLFVNDVINK